MDRSPSLARATSGSVVAVPYVAQSRGGSVQVPDPRGGSLQLQGGSVRFRSQSPGLLALRTAAGPMRVTRPELHVTPVEVKVTQSVPVTTKAAAQSIPVTTRGRQPEPCATPVYAKVMTVIPVPARGRRQPEPRATPVTHAVRGATPVKTKAALASPHASPLASPHASPLVPAAQRPEPRASPLVPVAIKTAQREPRMSPHASPLVPVALGAAQPEPHVTPDALLVTHAAPVTTIRSEPRVTQVDLLGVTQVLGVTQTIPGANGVRQSEPPVAQVDLMGVTQAVPGSTGVDTVGLTQSARQVAPLIFRR